MKQARSRIQFVYHEAKDIQPESPKGRGFPPLTNQNEAKAVGNQEHSERLRQKLHIEPRHLKYFTSMAEERDFNRAAARIHLPERTRNAPSLRLHYRSVLGQL